MDIINPHRWNVTYEEATNIQSWLRGRVIYTDDYEQGTIKDVALTYSMVYSKNSWPMSLRAYACTMLISLPSPNVVCERYSVCDIGSILPNDVVAFSVIPPIIETLKGIDKEPQMVLCYGDGISHPRRFGLASHLGVLTGLVTVGIQEEKPFGDVVGSNIMMEEEIITVSDDVRAAQRKIGYSIPIKERVYPSHTGSVYSKLYISPGHRISVDKALAMVKFILKRKSNVISHMKLEMSNYIGKQK